MSSTAGLNQSLTMYQHPDIVHELFDDPDHVATALQLIGAGDSTCLTVLDVGCGAGAMLGHLVDQRQNWRYTGIDREPALIKAAARRYPEVTFQVDDLRTARLDQTFDVLLCLGHTLSRQVSEEDYAAALDTFAEHLRPGGLLLIDVVPQAVPGPMPPHTLTTEQGNLTIEASSVVRDIGFLDATLTWQIEGQTPVTEIFRQRATPLPELTHRLWPRGLALLDWVNDLAIYQMT